MRYARTPGRAPQVSITVVAYNSDQSLPACLESVREPVEAGLAEVIVVDNASPDGSAQMVADRFPQMRLVRSSANLGFGGGCNLAWPLAKGSYWLLLNPDVVVPRGGLDCLVRWMDVHPEIGAASPDLVGPDGRLQQPARRFPSLWRSALEMSRLHLLLPARLRAAWFLGSYREPGADELDCDWVPGAALIVRREVVQEVGLVPDQVLAYGEDTEWCWRIRKAGWRVGVCGGVRFLHDEGQSALRTWGAIERSRRMWSGMYSACGRMRGEWYARALIAVNALALLLEAFHPGRPPDRRRQAGQHLRTHLRLLAGRQRPRSSGRTPASPPGALR